MMLSIAIDGPVGAGKSSVSDAVADRLHILHLDTGAMYRAVGLFFLQAGIDPNDEAAVCGACKNDLIHVDVRFTAGRQATILNGDDVTDLIRTQAVGMAASSVSRVYVVRAMLVARQREIAKVQPILLDGRDIGTVVLPEATVKIFLTASAQSRAERRYSQLKEKGIYITLEQVLTEVKERDHQDMNRKIDPLRQADDAILIDSSHLSFHQTVDAILHIVEARYERKT
jgi:CMP/dCMP kinase